MDPRDKPEDDRPGLWFDSPDAPSLKPIARSAGAGVRLGGADGV